MEKTSWDISGSFERMGISHKPLRSIHTMKKHLVLMFVATLLTAMTLSVAQAALITGLGDTCLDVPDGDTTDGTPVQIFHCHGSFNQQWNIVNGQIIGIGGKCLDVAGGSTADGTPVQLFTCHGGRNQRWRVASGRITGIGQKCLDVPDSNTADRTPLQIFTCHGRRNQRWSVR